MAGHLKPRSSGVAMALGIFMALEAHTFLAAALLHAGVRLPIGIVEPVIIPAATVEGLIAVALGIAAVAVLAGLPGARKSAIVAHAIAVVGVLLGIVALALGRGPSTPANEIYHRVSLAAAVLVLIFLITPAGRAAFRPLGGPAASDSPPRGFAP